MSDNRSQLRRRLRQWFGRWLGQPAEMPPQRGEARAVADNGLHQTPSSDSTRSGAEDTSVILHRLRVLVEAATAASTHESLPSSQELIGLSDALIGTANEDAAIALAKHLTQLLPDRLELRVWLAELLASRGQRTEARVLLEQCTVAVTDAVRSGLTSKQFALVGAKSHFLLATIDEEDADLQAALEHYETALAYDFAYPLARSRADNLRQKLRRSDPSATPTIIGPGEDAGSRYTLVRELGRGTGGTVYLAHDRDLCRPLAVKILHPKVAADSHARTKLFCEARIAASLTHPQIITVYDLDEMRNLIAMEYCTGGTLAHHLATKGTLATQVALMRLAQIAAALDVVHTAGIVHRDIKPANLLLRAPPNGAGPLVLSDFGVAAAASRTTEQSMAGSLPYMAPEQRRGSHALRPQADLYACGVVFIEMVCGSRAIASQNDALDMLRRALAGSVPAEAGEALVDLAKCLLATDWHERPESAASVASAATSLAAAF